MIQDLWYKNAVIYCLDVETFMDGNGDGVGDFIGLQRRLDYLAGLGVTCLWLMPFHPTPNRDNGYDITDHYGVDPRLGTPGDFVEFTHQAKQRGMRVIIDLVVNHTSDRHPWFLDACKGRDSRFHDFYVWSDKKPRDAHEGMVFPGSQSTTWTQVPAVKRWYFHRFFPFQPELNVANPAVREELLKVMGFWLELGVSGFRVDAVPFLVELKGTKDHGNKDPYALLSRMREFLSWRSGDAILLAEANVTMDEVMNFYGKEGDRMQMVFNFAANQNFFLSLVTEDATPLVEALRSAPRLPHLAQWANFLRNHDELDLGRLPAAARKRVFAELGPEPRMQLYGRGLRRRLAPMLAADRRRLELSFSLMLSLPGTPVLWYGDELGMGEDLSLHERQSVRTPMQWSNEPHGGFTRAPEPFRPVVARAPFGFPQVNVEQQRRDPSSLLNWMERMVRMRKECPELGWGAWKLLRVRPPHVLALRYDWKGETLVMLHNLSGKACEVGFSPGGPPARLVHLLSEAHSAPGKAGRHRVTLEGYGYRWFRMEPRDVPAATA
ncbi:trehalose synthase [Myxococcus llanfairpwllgwyngyllgogerychwyrndrobwllllantysiliogogogochensis]|uniref:Trehalose synthase n=1 Tax=Myxococcus llanfairpwllgwyngyllgogerychwyrndrobwllllantysiliogogogochensis TaxID=2590453 RepID=A0A540WKK9_9BACT|nr:alpha-amylase family protein [Myxococcus llanfairpwllgwyngyllgogerychwyrndrobwllllantysiliogogogochensis]TQF09541.1 trehalose synthase [Myxococcus llanfairpwllgwyngyllgogerychwyrndrobwllllantysiliogogogochensis]